MPRESMTASVRRAQAVENIRERLEVIVALAGQRPDYPLDLQRKAEDIVNAVLALTKDRAVANVHAVDPAVTQGILSEIKRFQHQPDRVLPHTRTVTVEVK